MSPLKMVVLFNHFRPFETRKTLKLAPFWVDSAIFLLSIFNFSLPLSFFQKKHRNLLALIPSDGFLFRKEANIALV